MVVVDRGVGFGVANTVPVVARHRIAVNVRLLHERAGFDLAAQDLLGLPRRLGGKRRWRRSPGRRRLGFTWWRNVNTVLAVALVMRALLTVVRH
jgi:hypothetical protein